MLARSEMTKMRQQQEYPITSLNYHKGGLIMCSLVEGRDESPVSVISHSATAISHPSSACASMEHHLNHIINPNYKHHHLNYPHPCQEQLGAGSSTSEDDNSVYNLPNLFFETGALEELPAEAQNPYIPSKAISGNFVKLFEKKSLTSETDLADSSSDDEEHFSIDFQGLQDKSMVLRENFLKVSESMLDYHEEKKAHDKLSAKLKQFDEWKKDQRLINTPNGHLMEEEEPTMGTNHVSKGLLKTVNPSDNAWVRGSNYVVQREEKGPNYTSMEKAYQNASIRRERITSTKLAIVPSKWDDAGKWLCHNYDASNEKANYYAIPRQLPQNINTSPIGENLSFDNILCKDNNSAAPASQLLQNINVTPGRGSHSVHVLCRGNHDCAPQSPVSDGLILARKKIKDHGGLILEKKSVKYNVNDLLWQRPTRDYNSLNSGQIVGANSRPNNYTSQSDYNNRNMAAISASNSEINANYGSDQQYRSSANYAQRFKQHQILQKLRKKYASNGGLKRGEMVGEGAAQNLGNKTIGRNINAVSRISNTITVQASPQKAQAFTQDKYANTQLEGKLDEDIVRQIEFFVQTPKNGRSATMKDACTEVSPSISRRDMGTQMTPLTSSPTSNSTSPIKNNSPARHNTPARRSTSSNYELNNNISSTNDGINCGKDHLNLLELESCHLAKLELRDQLPSGSQLFHESFDKNSAVFCNNWSPTKLEEENVAGSEAVEIMNAPTSTMRFNVLEARAAAWEEAERAKFNAKFKREEAKIDAWVNLQRSRAEAELKKLEVRLEKLRSQATEKVMNKVVAAGKRAEEMRAAAEAQQAEQMRRVTERVSNLRKNAHFPGSFAVCFARNMP